MRRLLGVLTVLVGGALGPAQAFEPVKDTLQISGGAFKLTLEQDGFGPATAVLTDGSGRRHFVRMTNRKLDLLAPGPKPMAYRGPDTVRMADGEIVEGTRNIRAAWLAWPTRIYNHAILGDEIEAEGFQVALKGRPGLLDYRLEPTSRSVFEDRYPRLADLDGDGEDEIYVVRSSLDRGAAIAVFKVIDGAIRPLAQSQPIGMTHRWLNPVGVADFDGDGQPEIAAVVTPHIGGTLALYRLSGGRLDEVAAQFGFSNHSAGSRELGMSAILDIGQDGVPEIALPDQYRRAMLVVRYDNGGFSEVVRVEHEAEIVSAVIAADLDGDYRDDLLYGLADGTLVGLLMR